MWPEVKAPGGAGLPGVLLAGMGHLEIMILEQFLKCWEKLLLKSLQSAVIFK